MNPRGTSTSPQAKIPRLSPGGFARYFCWSIQVISKITPSMNIAPIVIHSTAFHTESPAYSNPEFLLRVTPIAPIAIVRFDILPENLYTSSN